MKETKHIEHSQAYGEMKDIINGGDIQHMQFSEFSEGHGSVYGTLKNGKVFRLHITELFKMIDEFNFSVYRGSGNVVDCTLKVNWGSTNDLREEKDFSYKANLSAYKKEGNHPAKVNYVTKEGDNENTKFTGYRTGGVRPGGKVIPYYSGQMIVTDPKNVKNIY